MSKRSLQNIFLTYADYLSKTLQPLKNRKAIYAISHCRTEEMGTSFFTCKENHVTKQYHSCRHRSCFICAQKNRLDWIEKQRDRLFDVPHFHVIFTLPHEYLSLWRYNESAFTDLIFKASKETLLELITDKKYHGVTPGILMALHTWGRQLTLHPHTHCLVTAGGLNAEKHWQDSGKFLLPIRVVKKLYRAKMQSYILDFFDSGDMKLPPDWNTTKFRDDYRKAYRKEWSVRIEERYDHGKGVMLYLSRYLKGGPINPNQITQCTHKQITFKYLDHRDKRSKPLRLQASEFLKRVLSHVPAIGKHTLRTYGLYASCSKVRHQHCVDLVGCLRGKEISSGRKWKDMLLFCSTCGGHSFLSYRLWRSAKGISINRNAPIDRAGVFVQQDDETDIAGQGLFSSA